MKKMIDMESTVERLSILRGYLLDTARLQEEESEALALQTKAEARGVELAMQAVKREAKENGKKAE